MPPPVLNLKTRESYPKRCRKSTAWRFTGRNSAVLLENTPLTRYNDIDRQASGLVGFGRIIMKISKLFAALLAVMLAVGAFGLSAFAGSVISTVEIKDLTEPVVGWEPEYNWAVVNQTEFTAVTAGPGGRWYESKDGKDYTLMPMGYESFGDGSRQFFKENYYYRFMAEYEPEQNCSWDEGNLTVKINGAAADYSISGKTLTVSKDFGPLTWEGLVSFVGITDVVTPKAGEDVSYSFKISEYSDVIASLAGAGARWDESSDGGLTWTALDPNQSSKFKEGCAYRFYIEVMAKSGSTLAGVIGATKSGFLLFADSAA